MILTNNRIRYIILIMKETFSDKTLKDYFPNLTEEKISLANRRKEKSKYLSELEALAKLFCKSLVNIDKTIALNDSLIKITDNKFDVKQAEYANYCLRQSRIHIKNANMRCNDFLELKEQGVDNLSLISLKETYELASKTFSFAKLVITKLSDIQENYDGRVGKVADFEEELLKESLFLQHIKNSPTYIEDHERMLSDLFDKQKEHVSPFHLTTPPRER